VVRAGRRSASRRQALAQTRTTPPRLKGDEYGADVRLHDARGIVRFAFIVRRAQTGPSDEHRRLSTTLAWMVSVGILYHLPRADGTARRGLKASASDLGTLLVFYPVTGSIKPEQCQGVCDKVTAEHGATQGAFFRFTVIPDRRSGAVVPSGPRSRDLNADVFGQAVPRHPTATISFREVPLRLHPVQDVHAERSCHNVRPYR
jgi:hypothetical protein